MKQLIFSVTYFYILFGLYYEGFTKETNWLNALLKSVQKNNREHQVLFIINDTNKSSLSEYIIEWISRKHPVVKISFEQILSNHKETIVNIQTSMIIIINLSKDMEQLKRIVEILSEFLGSKTRPKCLICLPETKTPSFYNSFLNHMWSRRFLDATIMEFLEGNKSTKLLNYDLWTPFLHFYNPYKKHSGTFDRIQYSESVPLFPEKTRDLHGHELKIGLVHVPPFVYVTHDNKSKVIEAYGTDVSLTKALSTVMNFSISWDAPTEESGWGTSLNCTKENSTGLLYKLMHNKLDFMGFENGRYGACYEQFYEHSKSTKFAKISIVVPILRTQANVTINTSNICYIILFVVLFFITWAISYFILYKPPSLNILQVGRILFGTTTPNEPDKTSERFVFAAILLSCLLQASNIYTLIAENNLKLDFKPEPETIEDVITFNLLPVIGKDYYRAFKNTVNETVIQHLLEKANTKISTDDCWLQLEREKNVACVTRSEVALANVETYKDSCGRPIMKVLNEFLRFTTSGMNMESGSPLVKRFDEIIQKFIESGLITSWQQKKFSDSSVVVEEGNCGDSFLTEEKNIKSQMQYIFTIGYVCSTVTFIVELLYVKFV